MPAELRLRGARRFVGGALKKIVEEKGQYFMRITRRGH